MRRVSAVEDPAAGESLRRCGHAAVAHADAVGRVRAREGDRESGPSRGGDGRARGAGKRAVRLRAAALLLVAALAGAGGEVGAEVLVSNTHLTADYAYSSIGAQRFKTGANHGGYAVSDVQILLEDASGDRRTVVTIRSDNNNLPGSVVATLSNPDDLTSDALNTFTAPAGTRLDASTTYWVVVNDGLNDERVAYQAVSGNGQTGAAGWSIGNGRRFLIHTTNIAWGSSDDSVMMAVNGAAIVDATLESLAVTRGAGAVRLAPAFDPEVDAYTATVGGNGGARVTVTAETNDPNASRVFVDGFGGVLDDADLDAAGHQVDLEVGANVIGVRVTGHDDVTERTYTVTVTRAPLPASDVPVGIESNHDRIGAGLEDLVLTLTRGGATTHALDVSVEVVQEQDWLASRDLSHLLTFPPGAATTELVLAASRFSSEPDATGTLTASAGGTAIAGGSKTVTIVSTAAAPITVRYDMPEYTFEENAAIDDLAIYAVATLHEDYPRAPSGAFLVTLSSRASTATSGIDYSAVSHEWGFWRGDYRHDGTAYVARERVLQLDAMKNKPFDIHDDEVYEGAERLNLVIEKSAAADYRGLVRFAYPDGTTCLAEACSPTPTYPVTITDEEDVPALSLRAVPASIRESDIGATADVAENVSVVSVAIANGKTFATERTVTLTFAGTAVEGTDYTVSPADDDPAPGRQVVLPALTDSVSVTVSAVDNAAVDGDRTVTVAGSLAGAQFDTATVTITDDETASGGISLGVDPVRVGEGDGATAVTVTAALTGSTRAGATTVTVQVGSGSADEGTDFADVADFEISIPAGSAAQTGTFTLDPTQDGLDEGDGETVAVSGSSPTGLSVAGAEIVIVDDDRANAGPAFSEGTGTTREVAENTPADTPFGTDVFATDDDGDTLTYTLEGTDAASFGIDPETGRLKTSAPLDYETRASYAVTVKAADDAGGEATIEVTIEVTDVDEQPDTPAAPNVEPAPNTTDSLAVSWTAPGLNGGPEFTGYELRYGTTEEGTWSETGPLGTGTADTVGGLAADTEYRVQVRALNGETDSEWSPSGTARTRAEATAVFFYASTYTAVEGGAAARVTVRLSRTPGAAVTIPLTATNQGGAGADDYSGIPASVTFGASQTSKSFDVTAVADDQDESGESVRIGFGMLPDGIDAASPSTATVSLRDAGRDAERDAERDADDAVPVCNMLIDNVTVYEGETARFRIEIDPPLPRDDRLFWYVHTYGSATRGVDMESGGAYVDLKAGATLVTGEVETYADDEEEPTEGFQIAADYGSWRIRPDWRQMPTCTGVVYIRDGAENTPPAFDDDADRPRHVDENTPPGRPLRPAGRPVSADDHNGDPVTYALEGPHAALFAIGRNSGELFTRGALDHETQAAYTVTVRAEDDHGGTATIDVPVNVADVYEKPGTPAAPTVTAAGTSDSLDVAWRRPSTDGGPDIVGYELRHRPAGASGWPPRTRHPGGATAATLKGLAADTGYEVRVRALNGETPSDWSPAGFGRTRVMSPSAWVVGEELTLRHEEPLDPASVPGPKDWVVRAESDGEARELAVAGARTLTVTAVAVRGTDVTLTLDTPAQRAETVTVSYLPWAMHPLRAYPDGPEAPPLTELPVRNETGLAPAGANRAAAPLPAPSLDVLPGESAASASTRLELPDRSLTDVGSLAGMTELDAMDLSGNRIADITPLPALAGLEVLDLSGNALADVSALVALSNLRRLNLSGNRIADIAPLAALPGLESLDLSGNALADVSALVALSNLRRLNLSGNRIADIAPLAALPGLESLDLSGNELADVSALAALSNLRRLDLSGNALVNVSAMVGLADLEVLVMDGNGIVDPGPLGQLPRLARLGLSANRVSEVALLAGLGSLARLDLSGNRVAQTAPLGELSGLRWLDLRANPVSDVSALGHLVRLRWLWLDPRVPGLGAIAPLTVGPAPLRIDSVAPARTDMTH